MVLESVWSVDFVLFEHSAAMTLSRRGGIVNDVSGTINFLRISLRSSLSRVLNASRRKSPVSFSTLVSEAFHPLGDPLWYRLSWCPIHLGVPFGPPRQPCNHVVIDACYGRIGGTLCRARYLLFPRKLCPLLLRASALQILHVSTDCRQLAFHPQ